MLLTEKESKALTDALLSHVKAAQDAEVSVQSEIESHLRFAANAFTTSGRKDDLSLNVTAWVDGRKGAASTNETGPAALAAVVRLAEQIAAVSPVDKEYVPTLGPQTYKRVDGFAEATASVDPAARARAVSDIIAACEKEGIQGAGFHGATADATARATKNGNFVYHRRSEAGLSVTARTAAGDGSGYFSRDHFDVARLDTARIARESIGKALRSRDAKPVEPGLWTVILEPQAVADLVGLLRFGLDARAADEGRSPFSAPGGKTRVGEKLFDERLVLYSDPWHPEAPGSPVAQGGLPAQKLYLFRGGTVENLVYSRFWAKQKDKEPTPGPVNGILESTAPPVSVEDMIAGTTKGLIVSRFWYLRPTDPRTASFTGLTRDGVWLVENGKVAHAARNLRFNQSLLQMLAPGNLEAIGRPERVTGSEGGGPLMVPALKIKEFRFTSLSDAV